jgi:branched-chain amino acid transport system ATP-binding protein
VGPDAGAASVPFPRRVNAPRTLTGPRQSIRHSRESGNPGPPGLSGGPWTPAFAGVTGNEAAAPLLRTEDLTVRFGGLVALNRVNFAVQRGEIRSIIGPNGAGKSTFFNCLTGVQRPSSGHIFCNGEEISGLPPDRISRKGIARSYQITNILPNATALENVRIAAQSRRHSWSLLTHYRAYRDIIEKAEAILEAIGLGTKRDELAANLSHGEQRNLEIGIALATEPQLLCLDEPTAGMSAAETRDTMELVRRIGEELTILIVEHDMQVVMELADRITVLHYGEILAEGTPAEIQQNPRVLEVYLKT